MQTSLSPVDSAFDHLIRSGPDPRVAEFWDLEKRTMDADALEAYLGVASHGEALYAKFLALVWGGCDYYGLDISDAAAVLSPAQRKLIAEWITQPIWP